MASYYDRVLEEFDIRESGYNEDIFDEGILLDEGDIDEGLFDRRKPQRPVRLPGAIGKASNFGRNVRPAPSANGNGNLVTKAELKSSLNSISEDVNALKKTGIALAASLKKLDDGYEKIIKGIARKDKTQDNFLSGTTMMSLLGTIANKPSLDPTALKVVPATTDKPTHIELEPNKDAIQVDLTKTLLFTMLPTLTGGSGSDQNMMMPLMMVLLLDKDKTSNNKDNTLLLMLPMMMMMNNKKS